MNKVARSGLDQDEVQALRQEAGSWLRGLRETAGLSQRELAKAVGTEYYTFISQIESGRGRVPLAQLRAWADALNVPAREFAIKLMRFYDPVNYELIFGEETSAPAAVSQPSESKTLEERIRKLESILHTK